MSAACWMAVASVDLPLLDGPFSTTTRPPGTPTNAAGSRCTHKKATMS